MSRPLIILLHSSKTMRHTVATRALQQPVLLSKARKLAVYIKTLSVGQLVKAMHISPALADKTHELYQNWTDDPARQTLAIDSFIGDIYSGLRADQMSKAERDYANQTLWILSGLYGFVRPYDRICPYRLEMGYKLPDEPFANLYKFWGNSIAEQLPPGALVVNTSSDEFTKVITPFIDSSRVVAPQFLTVDRKTGQPTFKVVHAKIARGAFVRWLIQSRVTDPAKFSEFADLNYQYDKTLSTLQQPTFVCQTFGGKGLSMKTER